MSSLRSLATLTLSVAFGGCVGDAPPATMASDPAPPQATPLDDAPRSATYGLRPVGWHHVAHAGYTEVVFASADGPWYVLGIHARSEDDSVRVRLESGGDAVEVEQVVSDAAHQRVVFRGQGGTREVLRSHGDAVWRVDGGPAVENPTSREALGLAEPDVVLDHEHFAVLLEILTDDELQAWFEANTPYARPDLNTLGKICTGAQIGGVACGLGGAILFPTGCAVVGAIAGACTIIDFAGNMAGDDPFEDCSGPPGGYCSDCDCDGSPDEPDPLP